MNKIILTVFTVAACNLMGVDFKQGQWIGSIEAKSAHDAQTYSVIEGLAAEAFYNRLNIPEVQDPTFSDYLNKHGRNFGCTKWPVNGVIHYSCSFSIDDQGNAVNKR